MSEERNALLAALTALVDSHKQLLRTADIELKHDTNMLSRLADMTAQHNNDRQIINLINEIRTIRRTRLALTLKALLDDLTTD